MAGAVGLGIPRPFLHVRTQQEFGLLSPRRRSSPEPDPASGISSQARLRRSGESEASGTPLFPGGGRFQGPGPPPGGVQKAEAGGKHPCTLIWYLGGSQETLAGACSLAMAENAPRETVGSSAHVARASPGPSCPCPLLHPRPPPTTRGSQAFATWPMGAVLLVPSAHRHLV